MSGSYEWKATSTQHDKCAKHQSLETYTIFAIWWFRIRKEDEVRVCMNITKQDLGLDFFNCGPHTSTTMSGLTSLKTPALIICVTLFKTWGCKLFYMKNNVKDKTCLRKPRVSAMGATMKAVVSSILPWPLICQQRPSLTVDLSATSKLKTKEANKTERHLVCVRECVKPNKLWTDDEVLACLVQHKNQSHSSCDVYIDRNQANRWRWWNEMKWNVRTNMIRGTIWHRGRIRFPL